MRGVLALVYEADTMRTDDLVPAQLIPSRGFNEASWPSDELLGAKTRDFLAA